MKKSAIGWLVWLAAVAVVSLFLIAAGGHMPIHKKAPLLVPKGPPLDKYWLD
jgi:hypothetical protein